MSSFEESKHPRSSDGKFSDGSASVQPASELKKKPTEELTKINPWDDEKTRKMKMKLAKMHAGNQAIRDDIAKRKAHIEQMKKELGKARIAFAACSDVKTEGEATWFQTFPAYGRYPVGGIIPKADPKAEFIFDEASAKIVIDAFNAAKASRPDWPGILVDREHFSTDREKTSDAMAWATDIRQEEDGSIWTKWEFTPAGRELWESKTLVNRSPFFACSKSDDGLEYHPLELVSIGMTNTPHFKDLSNLAAARAAEVTNTQGDNKTMNEIIALLGLAEGASEEDVLAAVKALQDKASAAETAKAEAEKAKNDAEAKCRKMECDAFIEANKAKIADEAACREVYMANPEAAAKLIAACKEAPKPAETQTVLASAKKTPSPSPKKTFASAKEELSSLPCDQRQAFYLAHKDEIDG